MKSHHVRRGLGPARIVEVRLNRPPEGEFAELLDRFGGLGFQDRVRVIAKPPALSQTTTRVPHDDGTVGLADRVDDGTGT